MAAHTTKRVCPACRFTLLSTYNSDPLCNPCMQDARTGEGIAPSWLWDSAPLRAALARADMAAVLAILRAASGMSQITFGELLGWSQSVITKIERRERRTFHDIGEILRVFDLLGMPRNALLPLVTGHADAMLDEDEKDTWGESMHRRQFNHLAVGVTVAALMPAPEQIGQGHVRYLKACLDKLLAQDRMTGDGLQLAQAVRLYQQARVILDDSEYSERVGNELITVTTDIANSAGWLAFDRGNQKLARTLYTEAAHLADSAGIPEQQVDVYANLLQQSTRLSLDTGQRGHAREALRFAARATDLARHISSPRANALIAMRSSLAHAQLGDTAAHKSAINLAHRELDRVGSPGTLDPSWTSFVTHSEAAGLEAMGKITLGETAPAINLYLNALEDKNRSLRDLRYYRSCLAGTLCIAGDVKSAVTEGLSALPEPGQPIGSMRVLNKLSPVRAAFSKSSEDEFCVRFDSAARILKASLTATITT